MGNMFSDKWMSVFTVKWAYAMWIDVLKYMLSFMECTAVSAL